MEKHWMILMKEMDGSHWVWNGQILRKFYAPGQIPEESITPGAELTKEFNKHATDRSRVVTMLHARYRILARGPILEF